MNSREKIVQQAFLNDESRVIKRLNSTYKQAYKGITAGIEADYEYINSLTARINALPVGDPDRVLLESQRQSRVYRVGFQEALQGQVESILNNMKQNNYLTVSDYLERCYDNGFLGTMYDLHGQGIPLIIPIDQQKVTRAVQLESKISEGLYTKLGEDVELLKRKITAQVSLSMVTGQSYNQCAQRLADYTTIGFNRAVKIARTEGHRIQATAAMDAATDAKDKGADVLKQWDATLDGNTRDSHRMVDGEIRELEKPFSNGLMFPGDPNGSAAEVINCRCALLQRARWALDDDELQALKDRAAFYGLDKTQNFEEFKAKYIKAIETPVQTSNVVAFVPAKTIKDAEQYAQQRFGVEADYSKFDLAVANKVNETMYQIENVFGNQAFLHLHRIGTFPKGYTTRWLGAYVTHKSDPSIDGSLWLRNVTGKNAFDKMKAAAQRNFDSGFWSTADTLHVIRHELGHAVHRAIGTPDINSEVIQFFHGVKDERMRLNRARKREEALSSAWLSDYGFTNASEFVAESIAEYLGGNPRATAARVVEILTRR